ncbi:30S ribosomal protein S1 [Gordoniibacillus kamchatkensis]|uniref:30S ribosomal protein S1 n=1 Tax=Gordoniibacillus kamchatkensis TaxID=1590651 RepID=A0ABR5AKT7_9BACL|nr:30S ribosomal protein S1 [Paenibacillus sp. VKM B-2647]KIL41527.1 30S ribosomal protein S1 [Paenibacillus sp. VKM B-2647]
MSDEVKVQENEEQQAAAQAASDEDAKQAMANVSALKKGDTVRGKIIKVDADQAIVDVGYKYDGVIPVRELSSVSLDNAAQAVEVGQEVELRVVSNNDAKEQLILSKRAIDSEKAWERLQKAMEDKEILEATVAEVVKGGLVVDVGMRGFVPASMVERHFVEDFSDYKGRALRLRVKEMDREKNKVILSQKDVLDEEYEQKKQEIMGNLQVGQVLEGTVQRLTPFGAFVDIGGIDGLVHISEMAWHHVEKASDVVKEGDKVKVQVLKLDPEKEKISLSIKATQEGPWDQAAASFKSGDIVTGTVKRLASFGAFVEIAPGVEGLVHISQIAHRHIGTPHEVLKEGQQVNVKILDLNAAEKRASLSIKETEEAPAQEARAEREPRERRSRGDRDHANLAKDIAGNENVSLSREGLSMTLGERFGDKLSKFK